MTDALTTQSKEISVGDMGGKKNAATRDAPTKFRKEDSAGGTVQSADPSDSKRPAAT